MPYHAAHVGVAGIVLDALKIAGGQSFDEFKDRFCQPQDDLIEVTHGPIPFSLVSLTCNKLT